MDSLYSAAQVQTMEKYLRISPDFKAHIMAALMALYSDSVLAVDAYETLISDAFSYQSAPKTENILDSSSF